MSTAAEAKFRINAPNSQPRAVKIIALDGATEEVVRKLAQAKWNRASFLTAASFAAKNAVQDDWLRDLAGEPKKLADEVDAADLVVVIAGAGENAGAAATIGQLCRDKNVVSMALVVGSDAKPDDALAKTLGLLRPHSLMVVIASSDEYIEDMLTALRA